MPAPASKSRSLRPGYTSGACAAAAAKGATLLLFSRTGRPVEVDIPFPDGTRHVLKIARAWREEADRAACASVIKDAGDDPDVTHGAEIVARVVLTGDRSGHDVPRRRGLPDVTIKGGEGVGMVTRPGLPVAMGEPAINPGPRGMVREAVIEAIAEAPAARHDTVRHIEVTISVPEGVALARKTLNSRLGIVGGISILGTTGIVVPLSSDAWTATITASMNVAEAMGSKEIVLSSGRASERAHMGRFGLPDAAYVMMGDYVEYALREAGRRTFDKVHLCAQWAKMLKIAMAIPQTHVRHGAIDLARADAFVRRLGHPGPADRPSTSAREMFERVASVGREIGLPIFSGVCAAARQYAESITGRIPVVALLVSYEGEVIAEDG
ncbi:MAG: cobalt-precorrin-5B (C(1))-methyltransferase CbiD [Syntrophorhabdales bacterium]|jgi:cobalt-precorrin-5B (C1)-methyltransferase